MLEFRGLWNANDPKIADIEKIKKKIRKIPKGSIIRLGGMPDCFQSCELQHRITYEVIREMNRCGIGYLIVTKSDLISETEYLDIMDRQLAHIQISVTCLDDQVASKYEHAATPTKRVDTVLKLQLLGFDVSLRISPL